ncbi:MAG: ankyrin repeat domain-containing protein [Oligoflexales bacterium]|nr:ankyrin repeat domain-containing protein [Oligoflexales bacterium]
MSVHRLLTDKAADDGSTPLYVAAQKGHFAVVKGLITAGADMNKAANDGSTPYVLARCKKFAEIEQLLKSKLPFYSVWTVYFVACPRM